MCACVCLCVFGDHIGMNDLSVFVLVCVCACVYICVYTAACLPGLPLQELDRSQSRDRKDTGKLLVLLRVLVCRNKVLATYL